jgi:hypothetical protein
MPKVRPAALTLPMSGSANSRIDWVARACCMPRPTFLCGLARQRHRVYKRSAAEREVEREPRTHGDSQSN